MISLNTVDADAVHILEQQQQIGAKILLSEFYSLS